MKFYSTILMAVVLFALCLHERKAKESAINEGLKRGSGFTQNSNSYLTFRSTRSSKLPDFPISELAPGFSADTTTASHLTSQKPLLNISLSNPFFSRR